MDHGLATAFPLQLLLQGERRPGQQGAAERRGTVTKDVFDAGSDVGLTFDV